MEVVSMVGLSSSGTFRRRVQVRFRLARFAGLAALLVLAANVVPLLAPSTRAGATGTGKIAQTGKQLVGKQGSYHDGNWPKLSQNASAAHTPAAQVRSLQYLLDAHGARLVVDGRFGPRTDAALRSFQKAKGLEPTVVTTPATWHALIVTVRRGSVGDAVRAVQDQINFRNLRGPPYLAVDGIFGPVTEGKVRNLQAAWHIRVDGIIGPVTWRYLISEYMSG